MRNLKKLCAVLLALMLIITSLSGVFGVLVSAEETTATLNTSSALEFLKAQTSEEIANGVTSNKRYTQSGPWYTASTLFKSGNVWSLSDQWHVGSGGRPRFVSNWSYWAPGVGIYYKGGNSENGQTLRAWLRNNSSITNDNGYNGFTKLYYVAEKAGEYTIENPEGFSVFSSDVSGYEAYFSVFVCGEEIYKTPALNRINRKHDFEAQKVTLNEGDKVEFVLTYVVTSESGKHSGGIHVEFNPSVTLDSELELVKPEGTGSVADMFFDDLNSKEPTKTTVTNEDGSTSTKENLYVENTQTGVWRAQTYKSGSWIDNPYYWNGTANSYDNWMEWGYTNGSYSQHPMMAVRYYNDSVANHKVLLAKIPLNFANTRAPIRVAYTAEYTGSYTLTDKTGEFYVYSGSATVFEVSAHITVNGQKVWSSSSAFSTKGQSVKFDGYTADLKKGDVLAIEFDFKLQKGQTDASVKDSSSVQVRFAPELSYLPKESSMSFRASDAYNNLFEEFNMASGDAEISGTLSQPSEGWIFKYGKNINSLSNLKNYYYSGGDISWGQKILNCPSYSGGSHPGVFINIGNANVSPAKDLLYIRYRGCVKSNGIASSHQYSNDFSYTFIAPKAGSYKLSKFSAIYKVGTRTIADVIVKIYKNGTLIYSSDKLTYDNTQVVIPEQNFVLETKDEISVMFERQNDVSVTDWNNNIYITCDPTITYIPLSDLEIEKEAYTPVQDTRYYAENVTAPVSVSAFVKTDDILGGNIVSSNEFTLDIATKGYPRVTLSDDSEIIFPVDIRSDSFNHIAVVFNKDAGEWALYLNGVKVSTVAGAGISADTISKLYVGASADKYNNGYFKGSIAEVALFATALSETEISEIISSGADNAQNYWALSNVAEDLTSEELSVPEYDKDDKGIAFSSQNKRLDLYEEFEGPVGTFETWLRLDNAFVDGVDAGIIASSAQINNNTSYGSAPCVTLRIAANGKPALVLVNSSKTTITFNTDIRSDDWVHLAITADYDAGYYYCYINGELADKQSASVQIPVTLRPYVVSGNYFNQDKPYYFQGDLAGISMFADARTQEEILNDMYGVDLKDSDLFGSWHIDDASEDQPNRNGDGNDLYAFWANSADEVVDESFGNYSTFVFIPDTQNFTQSQGADGLKSISNWILNNKEKENIVGVMGLGDITNNNSASQWNSAKEGFAALKGQVPFVFVSGNHDIEFNNPSPENPRDVTNFNNAFPYADWEPYMTGFYEEGKIDNMYYLLEDVNGEKYMMLGLEFQPRDSVLEWANKVVSEHPDYKVIVTTHGYQSYDYKTKENYYITSNSYADVVGSDTNTGSQIWDKFASQHENIQAVLCGHVYHEDIHYTTNTGVNGNKVVEIIANAQTTDTLMRMSGTILIMRISEDGTKANLNYYSPYHNHYLKDLNQFTIDWIPAEGEAAIDDVPYSTLAEAISAAEDGDTVKLLKNVIVSETIAVAKNIKIDTADYTVTNSNGEAVFDMPVGMGMSYTYGVYTFDADSVIADIDMSGKIDSNDLAYIRQVLLKTVNDGKVYDINGDGAIDIRDLVRIKKLAGDI